MAISLPVAELRTCIDEPWTRMAPIRLGGVPTGLGTPDSYVTVASDEAPLLRVDLFVSPEQCHAFAEALVWSEFLAIGWGHSLYLVRLGSHDISSFDLGSYFGQAYPFAQYFLVASAGRLFRIDPEGALTWRSEELGIDGVIVHSVAGDVIEGDGEWDPPDGWRPFRVSLSSGRTL